MSATLAIDGQFIAGENLYGDGEVEPRYDPADERVEVSRQQLATPDDAQLAVTAAVEAADAWARTPGPARAAVLHGAATILERDAAAAAAEITSQEGKPLAEAHAEVLRSAALLRFFAEQARGPDGEIADAEEAGTTIVARRRPLGAVALITPWNFPLAIPARKAAPALAFGNTVVLKPSTLAARPALRLARALHEAGLAPGCLNVVVGHESAAGRLVDHPALAAVSFTGSTAVGQAIAQRLAARGVPFQGEMGGHSPVIVLADADPELAAAIIAQGAFASAGQTCTATRRVIVEDTVHDAVRAALVRRARSLRVGPGTDAAAEIPPLVSSGHRARVLEHLDDAANDGAVVLHGGQAPGGDLRHGAFLTPTVLGDVSTSMRCAETEIFGPVCSIIRVADSADAIATANLGPYGLSAAIVTGNVSRATALAREIQSGMLHVNRPTVGADPHMSFGGVKASAAGPREQGRAAREFFTHEQTIYVHGWWPASRRGPPGTAPTSAGRPRARARGSGLRAAPRPLATVDDGWSSRRPSGRTRAKGLPVRLQAVPRRARVVRHVKGCAEGAVRLECAGVEVLVSEAGLGQEQASPVGRKRLRSRARVVAARDDCPRAAPRPIEEPETGGTVVREPGATARERKVPRIGRPGRVPIAPGRRPREVPRSGPVRPHRPDPATVIYLVVSAHEGDSLIRRKRRPRRLGLDIRRVRDVDLVGAVRAHDPDVSAAHEGDVAPVRRVGGVARPSRIAGEPHDVAAIGPHPEDLGDAGARRVEGDPGARRIPARVLVGNRRGVERETLEIAAIGVDGEDLGPEVDRHVLRVEAAVVRDERDAAVRSGEARGRG
jgi:aldehyde dehydrogenase (NAD+)